MAGNGSAPGIIFDAANVSVATASLTVVMGGLVMLVAMVFRVLKKKDYESSLVMKKYLDAKHQDEMLKAESGNAKENTPNVTEAKSGKQTGIPIKERSISNDDGLKMRSNFVADMIESYHMQALSQAKVQFWFSVVAATTGFLYILYAAQRTADGTWAIAANTLPGVVIDAVAFLFFRQAEQTRERATELYDRLRQDRQTEKAYSIVDSIDDWYTRSMVKAQIALHMSGLSPKVLDLQSEDKYRKMLIEKNALNSVPQPTRPETNPQPDS